MARESALWTWLKKARLHFRSELHMRRIENGAGAGPPDVEGQLKLGGQFWCELKSGEAPARASGIVRFKVRDSQVEWMRRRIQAGATNVWFLCQVGSGRAARRYLLHGRHAKELQFGFTEQSLEGNSVLRTRRPTQLQVLEAMVDPRRRRYI